MKNKKTKSLIRKALTYFIMVTIIAFFSMEILHHSLDDELKGYSKEMRRELQQERNRNMKHANKDTHKIIIIQYAAALLLIIAFIVSLKVIFKRLWNPFNRTLNILEGFSIEKGVMPQFTETDVKEFIRLNTSLEEMMKKSISAYRSQKEFTENASHELHTPLAIIQSQLDLLIQRPDLTEEQSEIVSSIYSIIGHLTMLNKNLLLLAKIENQNQETNELVNISELAEETLLSISTMLEKEELKIDADIQEKCFCNANKALFVSLLNNLLANAIRYNHRNGNISLNLTESSLAVSNTGGNTMLDTDAIFRRFNKDQKTSKGHGLGLSIVEKICCYHGWEIQYTYESSLHTFTVKFHPHKKDR